jgi:hypothetical protein
MVLFMLLIPAEGVKTTAGGVCELVTRKGGVMSAERDRAGAPLVLDGNGLNCEKVRDVAREGRLVAIGPALAGLLPRRLSGPS